MARFEEIIDFFNRLESNFARRAVPRIIAETATEFFKQRFTTKEWEGTPWPPAKKPPQRGTLLLRTGALVNSIRPKEVNEERVVISAGNDKVTYAQIHNEGGAIKVPVTDKMRKFAWAMHHNQTDGKGDSPWKGLALTKKDTINIIMPQRRFMGPSANLNTIILDRLKAVFNELF